MADFCFAADGVEIRIPWGLLNFSNPAERMIHDDYYEHYGVEYIQIDEMFVGAAVASDIKGRIPMASFPLEGWGEYEEYQERLKNLTMFCRRLGVVADIYQKKGADI